MITSVAGIAGTGHNGVIRNLLGCDHAGDELGVVRKVCVHDDDKGAGGVFEAMDVGGTQA